MGTKNIEILWTPVARSSFSNIIVVVVVVVSGPNYSGKRVSQANGSTSDGYFAAYVEHINTECRSICSHSCQLH